MGKNGANKGFFKNCSLRGGGGGGAADAPLFWGRGEGEIDPKNRSETTKKTLGHLVPPYAKNTLTELPEERVTTAKEQKEGTTVSKALHRGR